MQCFLLSWRSEWKFHRNNNSDDKDNRGEDIIFIAAIAAALLKTSFAPLAVNKPNHPHEVNGPLSTKASVLDMAKTCSRQNPEFRRDGVMEVQGESVEVSLVQMFHLIEYLRKCLLYMNGYTVTFSYFASRKILSYPTPNSHCKLL